MLNVSACEPPTDLQYILLGTLQLVGSFITDIGVLVSEAVQRRTFLMKNAARLGPNGLERAASWPLGDIRGVQRCIMVAVSHVAGLCLFWQLLNFLV